MILSLLLAAATMGHPAADTIPNVECRVERVAIGVPVPGKHRLFRDESKGWRFEFSVTWPAQ